MVKMSRFILGLVLTLLLGLTAFAQAADDPWVYSYAEGLSAAKKGDWAAARAAFQRADSQRKGDVSEATMFDEGPTRKIAWRKSAPYSPKFAAAYAAYRLGMDKSGAEASELYQAAAQELEPLRAKGSLGVYFLLANLYGALGQAEKKAEVEKELASNRDRLTFRSDTELMVAVDLAAAKQLVAVTPAGGSGSPTAVNTGRVPYDPLKYAILIGVSAYGGYFPDMPFAVNDCNLLSDTLQRFAGYQPDHVLVVAEPNYEKMLTAVTEFAAKLPPEAVVFFFYAGAGFAGTDKTDYLVPSGSKSRTEGMVKKTDLLAILAPRARRTIAVFEVDRQADENKMFFGSDTMKFGGFSQINACTEEQRILSQNTSKGVFGVWPLAASWVLENRMRGQRVNAKNFCFEVNGRMLEISTGSERGVSQTTTLPTNTLLGDEATF